ncbi:MAG: hypothetical protein GF417_07510 [Candidatus Latescibacteria bacterium]|nr:hypothetical protein [bacterium]MBD3424266.1 hypothetical protein [Candidatus Latescibacterota bacterium]
MDCLDYQKLISRWLDGEISESQLRELNEHLENCRECRELKSELTMVHRIHSELPDEPVPDKVLSGYPFDDLQKRTSGITGILRNAAVAAAMAGVILGGVFVGGFLAERSFSYSDTESQDPLNLEYLYAVPPGSTGDILLEAMEDGE